MNKSLAIFLVILLTIVVAALTGGFIYMLNNNIPFSFDWFVGENKYSTTLVEAKTFDTIKDINIYSKNGDVTIEESEDNKISVEFYSDKVEEEYIKDGNEINVKLYNKAGFAFNFKTDRILVKLPKEYANKISINNNVGDIKITSIDSASTNIVSTIGDINIESINDANITNDIGDIKIEKINTIISVNKTGDVKINNVNEADIKVDTGDIKITNLNNKMNIKSGIGDVKIENVTLTSNSTINGSTGDVIIKNITGAYVEANTKIGDVKVNNTDRKSDIVLTINNSTGDIKVNND